MKTYTKTNNHNHTSIIVEWTPLIIVDHMLDDKEFTLYDADECPIYFYEYNEIPGFDEAPPAQYDGRIYWAEQIDENDDFTSGGQYKIIMSLVSQQSQD